MQKRNDHAQEVRNVAYEPLNPAKNKKLKSHDQSGGPVSAAFLNMYRLYQGFIEPTRLFH